VLALGLWLLGGLAAVVFAAAAGRCAWQTLLPLAVGFGLMVAAAGWALDPVWTGATLTAAALAALFDRLPAPLAALLAGLAAGSWLLIPAALSAASLLLGLIALLAALYALRRAGRDPLFAAPALRDEALLIVLGLASVVTIAEPLAAGWASAANLYGGVNSSATTPALRWPLPLLLVALLGGALVSNWRRR
jgi:hypothetical protein